MTSLTFTTTILLLTSLFTPFILANPNPLPTQNTQYCRFGHSLGQADFCLGVSVTNHSNPNPAPGHEHHRDFSLSLSIRRSGKLGWTAIGTGPKMAGSIMIIVYGDPNAKDSKPVVSIRTVDGHHQPKLISHVGVDGEVKGEEGGQLTAEGRVRVLRAEWVELEREGGKLGGRHDDEKEEHQVPSGPPTHAARVEVLCEKCDEFGSVKGWGGAGTGKGGSMPWIWAFNDNQDFEHDGREFGLGAKLKMHRHREGSGGYGRFWVDMARATGEGVKKEWDFEEKRENERVGTSDGPIGFGAWFDFVVRVWSLAKVHGVVMGVGFLGLFPLGVVFIRMKSRKGAPFKRHWRIQAVATSVAGVGAMIGGKLSKWHMPKTLHQWLGLGIVLGLVVQSLLGWRHHVDFVRIKRRTWISYGHVWLGRFVVAGGLVNVVLGMMLSGKTAGGIWLVGVVGLVEAAGLGYWLWRAEKQRQQVFPGAEEDGTEALALMPRSSDGGENYFAIDESEEESSEEDDDGKISDEEALRKRSVESGRKSSDGVKD
ncbi:hypothetical protein B0T21DRAFT_351310 [Apiosordaria backusii]|uniref:Cytochrome b561 domain-containing protein n=1 Tax=Apiosordaria backusii TaxID=314023 RepID=A0AA40ASU2_9PEZI|nr:hypothetical protein B0T21DRAFT_351310 [Apiosordaria backusii]